MKRKSTWGDVNNIGKHCKYTVAVHSRSTKKGCHKQRLRFFPIYGDANKKKHITAGT